MGRGASGLGGAVYGGAKGTFTQAAVDDIISNGGNRWTKYGKDRLYLGNLAYSVGGLDVSRYKTGNISGASIDGETISNSGARRLLNVTSDMYINLQTGGINVPNTGSLRTEEQIVVDKVLNYVKGKRRKIN